MFWRILNKQRAAKLEQADVRKVTRGKKSASRGRGAASRKCVVDESLQTHPRHSVK